jgi:FkbM family methyltransferase
MTRVSGPLDALARYARVMQTPLDFWRYMQLRRSVKQQASCAEAKPLRVRSLGGAAMLCRPTQDVWTFKHTFLEGFHMPPRELPDHATIVDLGSNVGYTVADLAYRHPTARVIGLEMDARNVELARRNTAWLGPRVEIIHAAAWTSDGEISYAGEADDAFTVTDEKDGADTRTAPAKSLETLFADCALERVDYVKMDIEGAEGAILAGAMKWAERVRSMKIEVHPPVKLEWCRTVLESQGFRCWVDDQHWNCVCAVRD